MKTTITVYVLACGYTGREVYMSLTRDDCESAAKSSPFRTQWMVASREVAITTPRAIVEPLTEVK